MVVDSFRPDRCDLASAALCLAGVAVIMYSPGPARSSDPADQEQETTVTEANKRVVRRLVAEVFNGGHLEVIDELYAPELAGAAVRWIAPFRASFPDVYMELVELIAEGDKVVGRFTCSATHLGAWLGRAPTGRRFERVDEVWILRFRDGQIVHVWSLEDTLDRLRQLGLTDRHG
jgi:predicted ester cyclase